MPVSIYGDGSISGVSTLSTQLGVVTTSQLNVGTGGTVITTTASGLVGIGTDNPNEKLEIEEGNIRLSTDVGGTIPKYGINWTGAGAGQVAVFSANTTTGEVRMGADNASGTYFTTLYSNGSEKLRITAGGDVGIGTISPNSLLELLTNATSAAGGVTVNNTNAAGYSTLQLKNSGASGKTYTVSVGGNTSGLANEFYVYDDTAAAKRFSIDSSGRVTKPYQLWIAGSPTNTGGSGIFNSFNTSLFASPVGLSFVTDRITVPIAGVYLITFNTICDSTSIRRDTQILINGTSITNQLSEDTTTGFHYRSASMAVKLSASDFIQFYSDDWYNASQASTDWRTASVYLLG